MARPYVKRVEGEHLLTITAADVQIEVYQTGRKSAGGLIGYYRRRGDKDTLLRLGRALHQVAESIIGDIVVLEFGQGDQPIPEDRLVAFPLEQN